MTRDFEIRLASAVKFSLSTTIALVTLALGYLAYRDLHDVILRGFDRKLKAIATTTSSFIDSEAHRRLEQPSDVLGFAFDPDREALLAFDARSRRLVEIDTETGLAEPIVPLALDEIAGFAYDTRRSYPLVLGASGWLLRVDRAHGRAHPIGDIGRDDCLGLAYEPSSDALYCAAGTTLLRLDPENAAAEEAGELDGFFRWLAPASPGWLWGFDIESRRARQIRLPTASADATPPAAPRVELASDVLDGGVHGLAAGPGGSPIWLATDRLLRLDGDTVNRLGLTGFRSEQSADYQRFIKPMRRIRESAGITFLYTQVPHTDPGRCIYILDAGLGEERAELGSVDDLEEESILGQRQALNQGEIFLSSVRPWEQWGLLKVVFAPIVDRRGESTALAGADVNISIIREKTRASLLRVLATGVFSLLIGLAVAVYVARRITDPVAKVKETALALAAGQFVQPIKRGRLIELHHLSRALDTVGETLEQTLSRFDNSNRDLERRRRLRHMVSYLSHRVDAGTAGAELSWQYLETASIASTSGVASGEAGTLAWFSPPVATATEAIRRRHDVQRLLTRLLARRVTLGVVPWSTSFPDWIDGFVFLPRGGDRLEWYLRRAVIVFRPGDPAPQLLDGDGGLDLVEEAWLLIAPPAAVTAVVQAPAATDEPPDLERWFAHQATAPFGLYLLVSANRSVAGHQPFVGAS